jgi:hypothetical protein
MRFQKALRRKSTGLKAAGLTYEEWRDLKLNAQRYRLDLAGRDMNRRTGEPEVSLVLGDREELAAEY